MAKGLDKPLFINKNEFLKGDKVPSIVSPRLAMLNENQRLAYIAAHQQLS
jgi:hypothetical protein